MKQFFDLDYVRFLAASEISGPLGRIWYLPHHGVESNHKLRIVFDASAKVKGASLNDALMKIPDLMQPQSSSDSGKIV